MLKKDINAFFKAVRSGDIEQVAELLTADKAYLTVCRAAPPKQDDGQSGLQVAFKAGQFAIATLLIEQGADVNFQETSTVNEWTAPVLHDAIRAALFSTWSLPLDTDKPDQALATLQLLLLRGACPQAQDSYGNAGLHRAVLDAKQVLDHPHAATKQLLLLQQVRQVFAALLAAGADPVLATATRPSATAMAVNSQLAQYDLW
jgi:ankyrin repeat protein